MPTPTPPLVQLWDIPDDSPLWATVNNASDMAEMGLFLAVLIGMLAIFALFLVAAAVALRS